jgi:UDP-N-acetylmuramoyl-L-alanyl-D-glutamate--2,6-diaminopimelate ligase
MEDLSKILNGIAILELKGSLACDITQIDFDSRYVTNGSLFVAQRGTKVDGHDFISAAISSGAVAVICEKLPEKVAPGICSIRVEDSSLALGIAASNFYNDPSSALKLVGVTGTNGKTTVASLLFQMFTRLGYNCGLFSTICNYIIDVELPATHTTPDPVRLNKLLSEMVASGCDYAFMEVSSHAVDQKRIAGLSFAGGIFTNLTHDHLDYHKTFDNYLAAKKEFFDGLPATSFALVNIDDRNGKVMLQNCKAMQSTFSTKAMADFRCGIIEQGFEGMALRFDGNELWTKFIGHYNASNLLAVYAASLLLGAKKEEVLTILSDLHPVSGRLEIIRYEGGISAIVDYAHTPDALQNVIDTINNIRHGDRQLITVVGAGGDRDKTKRPVMARICAEKSTRVILTSDNPRTEDPEKILDDMEAGIGPENKRKTLRISDRHEAIKTAAMLADEGDVILVAGKGHENYQEINGTRYHFDDKEELNKALIKNK